MFRIIIRVSGHCQFLHRSKTRSMTTIHQYQRSLINTMLDNNKKGVRANPALVRPNEKKTFGHNFMLVHAIVEIFHSGPKF